VSKLVSSFLSLFDFIVAPKASELLLLNIHRHTSARTVHIVDGVCLKSVNEKANLVSLASPATKTTLLRGLCIYLCNVKSIMYLIDTSTLKLVWFSEKIPPYAILSHTWGLEEVTFVDFRDVSDIKAKAGFYKIKQTCEQAHEDGLSYAWVDTCCINKESSAELSEALNCMFKWYRDAAICYAYIEDLSEKIELPVTNPSLVEGCKWFSRGWTLQELLAPRDIIFFGARWAKIGRKVELKGILEQVTGIPGTVLDQSKFLDQVSVADRMNWAANRQTCREEDVAYCLMGIFDVNMPMMYGEGRKAFIRLQEEIIKQTQDDSIFAWRASQQSASEAPYRGLLASSPKEFASEDSITPFYTSMAGATTILGNGRVSLSCALYQDGVLGLKCFRGTDVSSVVGIEVVNTGSNHFLRSDPSNLALRAHKYPATFDAVVFERFAEMREPSSLADIYQRDGIQFPQLPAEISLMRIYPREYEDFETKSMLPMVCAVGRKIAFELAVDRNTSGVDVFQQIGWGERSGPTIEGKTHILLILWVEQLPDTRSYACYFDFQIVGVENAESKFLQAKRPSVALNWQELPVAWSTIHVRGAYQKVNGHQVLSLSLNFVISEDIRAKAQDIRARTEAEATAKSERTRTYIEKQVKRIYITSIGLRIASYITTVLIIVFFFRFLIRGRLINGLLFGGFVLLTIFTRWGYDVTSDRAHSREERLTRASSLPSNLSGAVVQ
jgi:hypothetical protein